MTDKVSLPVAQRLKGMGWAQEKSEFYYMLNGQTVHKYAAARHLIVCACPTIGELQAVVTDRDIAKYLTEKLNYDRCFVPEEIPKYLRSTDLLAEVWMWKQEKGKR